MNKAGIDLGHRAKYNYGSMEVFKVFTGTLLAASVMVWLNFTFCFLQCYQIKKAGIELSHGSRSSRSLLEYFGG